jgi:hypothetical protein
MPTNEQKFNFIKRVYFGTTNNPDDDVNPYSDLSEFGRATVGTLRWGVTSEARQRSKIRFAHNFYNVLDHYNVRISVDNIYAALIDDKPNDDVVNTWVGQANFNII